LVRRNALELIFRADQDDVGRKRLSQGAGRDLRTDAPGIAQGYGDPRFTI
jgi:hypothetical protein